MTSFVEPDPAAGREDRYGYPKLGKPSPDSPAGLVAHGLILDKRPLGDERQCAAHKVILACGAMWRLARWPKDAIDGARRECVGECALYGSASDGLYMCKTCIDFWAGSPYCTSMLVH